MRTYFTAAIAICICMFASLVMAEVKHTGNAPDLIKGLQQVTISKIKSSNFPKKNKSELSPNGIYRVIRIKANKTEPSRGSDYVLYVDHGDASFHRISFTGVYGDCEVTWVSEKLIFIRAWWARHWGADYIFDVEKGVMIYEEGYFSNEWQNRIKTKK